MEKEISKHQMFSYILQGKIKLETFYIGWTDYNVYASLEKDPKYFLREAKKQFEGMGVEFRMIKRVTTVEEYLI